MDWNVHQGWRITMRTAREPLPTDRLITVYRGIVGTRMGACVGDWSVTTPITTACISGLTRNVLILSLIFAKVTSLLFNHSGWKTNVCWKFYQIFELNLSPDVFSPLVVTTPTPAPPTTTTTTAAPPQTTTTAAPTTSTLTETTTKPWWFVEYSADGKAIGKNGKVKHVKRI